MTTQQEYLNDARETDRAVRRQAVLGLKAMFPEHAAMIDELGEANV